MMDKVQKIREEVERLKEETSIGLSEYENGIEQGRMEIINALSIFLDSMKEETVSNPVDFEQELYKAFGQVKDFTLGMRIAKWFYDMGKKSREPVSEDLEEAVNAYIGYAPEVDESSSTYGKRQAFKDCAKWWKEQIIANTADAMIGLPYENKDGGYTHLVDVSRPLPVGDNKIAIIFKEGRR